MKQGELFVAVHEFLVEELRCGIYAHREPCKALKAAHDRLVSAHDAMGRRG